MSDMTVEQKLQLVRQVRSRYHENQYDMSNREQILYGKSAIVPKRVPYDDPYDEITGKRMLYGESPQQADTPLTSFGMRFFIAMLLLAAVIIMDRNSIKVAGITTEKIFQVISADYEDVIEEWVEAVSSRD